MKSVDIKYIHRVDVDSEFRQFLRENGVDTDDFDYILITDADVLEECKVKINNPDYLKWLYGKEGESDQEEPKKTVWINAFRPKDFYIENMLQGAEKNVWHKLTIDGKVMAVGIAYH